VDEVWVVYDAADEEGEDELVRREWSKLFRPLLQGSVPILGVSLHGEIVAEPDGLDDGQGLVCDEGSNLPGKGFESDVGDDAGLAVGFRVNVRVDVGRDDGEGVTDVELGLVGLGEGE